MLPLRLCQNFCSYYDWIIDYIFGRTILVSFRYRLLWFLITKMHASSDKIHQFREKQWFQLSRLRLIDFALDFKVNYQSNSCVCPVFCHRNICVWIIKKTNSKTATFERVQLNLGCIFVMKIYTSLTTPLK